MRTSRSEVPHQFAFGRRPRGRAQLARGDWARFGLVAIALALAAAIAVVTS